MDNFLKSLYVMLKFFRKLFKEYNKKHGCFLQSCFCVYVLAPFITYILNYLPNLLSFLHFG